MAKQSHTSEAGDESALARILSGPGTETVSWDHLARMSDYSMYGLLAKEVAHAAANNPCDGLLLILDSQTAGDVEGVDAAQAAANHVHLIGPPSVDWSSASNVTVHESGGEGLTPKDRFLVAYSSGIHLALVGEWRGGKRSRKRRFQGAWTGYRPHVRQIAQSLLKRTGCELESPLTPWNPDGAETSSALIMRLITLQCQQDTSQLEGVPVGRDDLFSVLEILKAISTERRSHDVLFVFVEQIARVVNVDRCSVVRVWSNENIGHVLASHEDERVDDLIIQLDKYPELRHAMKTGSKVVIADALHDPLTRAFANTLDKANVRSILVIPIVFFDEEVGSLLLRTARRNNPFSLREISFCEIVAEAASNALERAQLFDTIQRANERLERLAITDGLTRLYNHRFFRQRLEEEYERAYRYNLPLSCLMFDIDDFKEVNDTFGHLQGDKVLREIADCIAGSVRKSDLVARYGGEEFAVILPLTGLDGAKAEAERLRNKIEEHSFEGLSADWRMTASIGVAVFEHDTMDEYEALLRVADKALYEAKRRGKNHVVVGSP